MTIAIIISVWFIIGLIVAYRTSCDLSEILMNIFVYSCTSFILVVVFYMTYCLIENGLQCGDFMNFKSEDCKC